MALYKFTLTPTTQKQMTSEDRLASLEKRIADLGARYGGQAKGTKAHQPGLGLFKVSSAVKAHAAREIEKHDQQAQERENRRRYELSLLGKVFGA